MDGKCHCDTQLYVFVLQKPTSSCPRPNAIQYRVHHNVSNSNTAINVLAPTTTTTITGATLGSTYTIEVKASNMLGYGPTAVIKIGKPVVNIKGGIPTCLCTYTPSVIGCYN